MLKIIPKIVFILFFIGLITNNVIVADSPESFTSGKGADFFQEYYTGKTSPANIQPSDRASLDQSRIPSNRISEIGPDWVDVTAISDLLKLITPQLTYGDNLGRIDDLSKLDHDQLDKAMKEKFGITIPRLKSISNLDINDGKLKRLKTVYKNNNDILKIPNPLSSRVTDNLFKQNGNSGSGSTYSIQSYSNTKFDLKNIESLGIGNGFNDIIDFKHIDKSRESSIDIEKQNDGSYKITTSNLESTFHGNGFNEYVFGEKSVIA